MYLHHMVDLTCEKLTTFITTVRCEVINVWKGIGADIYTMVKEGSNHHRRRAPHVYTISTSPMIQSWRSPLWV